jgi:hypothetical protein
LMIGRLPDGTTVHATRPSDTIPPSDDQLGPQGDRPTGGDGGVPWEPITQVLGAGAALAAWIAVVGGGRVWAKLHASDIPATQTLSVLPRQLLIVEGLQTLFVPVVLGAGLAALVYFSRRSQKPDTNPRSDEKPEAEASTERLEPGQPSDEGDINGSGTVASADADRSGMTPGESPSDATHLGEGSGVPEGSPARPSTDRGQAAGATTVEQHDEDSKPSGSEKFEEWIRSLAEGLAPVEAMRRFGLAHSKTAAGVVVVLSFAALFLVTLILVNAFDHWQWMLGGFALGLAALVLLAMWIGAAEGAVAGLIAFVVLSFAGVLIAMGHAVRIPQMVTMAAVSAAALWVTIGALVRRGADDRGVALTLFAAVVLWSGTIGILGNLGATAPELELATVTRVDRTVASGFYLGGGAGDVYLASTEQPSEDAPRTVELIKAADVASLEFGGVQPVPLEDNNATVSASPTPSAPIGEPLPDAPNGNRKPLTHITETVQGRRLRLDIGMTLGPRLVVVDLRLTHLPGGPKSPPLNVGNLFDDPLSEPSNSTDGIHFLDVDASRKYAAARDPANRCICSTNLQDVTLDQGQSIVLTTTLGRPPRKDLLLVIPGFESVAITPP